MNEIDNEIAKIEAELGLPDNYFAALLDEDDWSFIIKCHALIESACSFLLTSYFNDQNYNDIFSRLEMSDAKTGKLAFLKAAGLVVSEEAAFIANLSELRNKLVHNIKGVAFKFADYISGLDKNQKKSFAKTFGYAHLETSADGRSLVLKDLSIVLSTPRKAIWNGVKLILVVIRIQVETRKFERQRQMHELKVYEMMKTLTTGSTADRD
jgi:hypothetical protein